MINYIWFAMLFLGLLAAAAKGDVGVVTQAAIDGADRAVRVALGLVGLIALWSGLMRIAYDSGLTDILSRMLHPVARRLFPEVPPDSPAMGAIVMSLSANILGLGNAATPLGLRAMEEMQKLNGDKETASPAMCTFLALCTSSVTLVPASVIAVRAAAGSGDPAAVVGTTIAATTVSTVVALIANSVFKRLARGG